MKLRYYFLVLVVLAIAAPLCQPHNNNKNRASHSTRPHQDPSREVKAFDYDRGTWLYKDDDYVKNPNAASTELWVHKDSVTTTFKPTPLDTTQKPSAVEKAMENLIMDYDGPYDY